MLTAIFAVAENTIACLLMVASVDQLSDFSEFAQLKASGALVVACA